MENKKESDVLPRLITAYDLRGDALFRNNSGAFEDKTGRWVRFGLGNDSKRINAVMKSGDLIGITKKLITPADVGKTIGVFTSLEAKKEGWIYTGTKREVAQMNWNNLINRLGGIAQFITEVN